MYDMKIQKFYFTISIINSNKMFNIKYLEKDLKSIKLIFKFNKEELYL